MSQSTDTIAIQPTSITPQELEVSLQKARRQNVSLVEMVLKEKKISEEALAQAFSDWLRLPKVKLATLTINPETARVISEELATKRVCLPLSVEGRTLVVAMANPTDYDAIQDVQFASGYTVRPVVATRVEIVDRIQELYTADERMSDFLSEVADSADITILAPESDKVDLDSMNSRSATELAPVVKMCNLILQEAIKAKASDVHLEPGLNSLQVRFRVDGVLREYMEVPKWLQNPLTSRLKILAQLDIAERRLPQDGRIKVNFQTKALDIRVSTLPTHFGEKVVLRVLGSSSIPTFEQMGLSEPQLALLNTALSQPQGMILVTGPTGSGKSTSLYSMVVRRKSPEVNIVTVEDPIEYQIPGINQVHVNVKTGLTFASCLRSILRQDPDVILLGEIRDLETAEIAFQAAMTGHLVLSTLHTNSAIAATTRLLDLGVDPFLITSSVNLILAQRLARRLCQACKRPAQPNKTLLERLRIDDKNLQVFRGAGCSACGNTGYAGRIGIFELLPITPTMKELLRRKASEGDLRKAAVKAGVQFLLDDALAKVKAGLTDLEEIVRVIELQHDNMVNCPQCGRFIELEFSACPYCLHSIRSICGSCGQDLKPDWKICPYCNTPVTASAHVESEDGSSHKTLGASAQRTLPEISTAGGEEIGPLRLPAPSTQPAPKKPRILIVDDDPGIQKVISAALTMLPLESEVMTASDGVEALEMASTKGADLVILDIGLPRMDGLTVCKKLREDLRTAFVPVVMLTANTDESKRTEGYLVGTDDYISKPFSVPDLNARVFRLLRRTYGL
jgi:type IV pilus assembly protein PilB